MAAPCDFDDAYPWLSPHAPVVFAAAPAADGCAILTRLKAFLVDRGVVSVLRHTVRDRAGRPVDLSAVLPTCADSATAAAGGPAGTAALVVREWTDGPVEPDLADLELDAQAADPPAGVLVAPLPAAVVDVAGIYRLVWLVRDAAGRTVLADTALLSVERGPWASTADARAVTCGPPTVGEVRNAVVDTGAADNLRLDDVEFSDDQILQALADPVRTWNEALPAVPPRYTTRTFPHRGEWLRAAVGHLHVMAATTYRRNRRGVQAAGVADDSLNRDREYLDEGRRLLAEYRDWVLRTKYAASMRRAFGAVGSNYFRG